MKIQILEDAEQDLIEGYKFYERQSADLGEYFLNSLFSDIDSLQIYAGIHAIYYEYHRLLSKRFPFAIYYKIQRDIVQVFAVLDCRRDPFAHLKRLK